MGAVGQDGAMIEGKTVGDWFVKRVDGGYRRDGRIGRSRGGRSG